MIIKHTSTFFKFFTSKWVVGIALFPFILVRDAKNLENTVLINHEKIHIRQQAELLIVFFYLWYLIEFLLKFLKYKQSDLAYRNISFEREAYKHENDFDYLQNRSFWTFLKYI